ncbi:beta-ketoacyl synthase N-terminal-like domain-containing protein [Streptomyces sp. col6]|uniref:beta-ketoacyl synthase N-terminal-like domain-containing protein n=1 Tax=Streptomyces sp. col6 TaxID=2478958 RepID=UPI0011CE55BB|nr:beta-ketoacyl synthase N-terminal-like domain-containing protein [Streptomyces sp. col6]
MTESTGVVVTGMGCVSPFGTGVRRFWEGLFTGREPTTADWPGSSGYRTTAVHEVPAWEGSVEDRPADLLAASADQALAQAGLAPGRLRSAGLALASTSAGWHLPDVAFGSMPPGEGTDASRYRKEGPAVSLRERLALNGPCVVLSSACASSTGALAWASERIRSGEAPVVLVAAVDVLTEVVFAGFHSMRLLSRTTTRPFAADRSGFVLAEGAAVVVLESSRHAAERGRPALVTVQGWGACSDAVHLTTPAAQGIARSLSRALDDAGRGPEEIGLYHAHGTASQAGDLAEAQAVGSVLTAGGRPVRTTAIKAAAGHTEGAAGLFTFIAATEGLLRNEVPPVLHPGEQDPGTRALALSDGHGPHPQGSVLVHASGFGGANCTVVLDDRPARPRPVVRRPVRVYAAASVTDGRATARGWSAGWDGASPAVAAAPVGNPLPDRTCLLVADAVGSLLGGLGATTRADLLAGGLLLGTEYGMQSHHARIHTTLRERGPRRVDPMDFALSTFNTPAAMASVLFGVTGQTETFLGRTAAVEALVSAAHLVATGRASACLAGGYDAPENRLWAEAGDPPVPPTGTVIAVGSGPSPAQTSAVELVAAVRLPVAAAPAGLDVLEEGLARLCPVRPKTLIVTGLDRTAAGLATDAGWTEHEALGGAAEPLSAHLEAMDMIARGEADEVVVAGTGAYSSTLLVHYRRPEPEEAA